jgi:hypothetical protein
MEEIDSPIDITVRRIVGFILLAVCVLNIILNLTTIAIYGGETPSCPGDTVKLDLITSEDLFWGVFYATGTGKIEYVSDPSSEFTNSTWGVVSRNLPGGPRKSLIKDASSPSQGKGPMNVNITIPDVSLTQKTTLMLQVVISGYVARPVGNSQFVYDQEEMVSVPFKLQVVPSNLKWLVHQAKWTGWCFLGIFFSVYVLLPRRKPKKSGPTPAPADSGSAAAGTLPAKPGTYQLAKVSAAAR